MTDEVLTAAAGLSLLAAEAGLTPAQLAVAWVLQHSAVSAAIVGATRPEQVRDNAGAAGVRLDADLMHKIDELLADVITRDPSRTSSPEKRP